MTKLKDCRPTILTFVVMKSFEILILAYLKGITKSLLSFLWFAYGTSGSVDVVVNLRIHHHNQPRTYARNLSL